MTVLDDSSRERASPYLCIFLRAPPCRQRAFLAKAQKGGRSPIHCYRPKYRRAPPVAPKRAILDHRALHDHNEYPSPRPVLHLGRTRGSLQKVQERTHWRICSLSSARPWSFFSRAPPVAPPALRQLNRPALARGGEEVRLLYIGHVRICRRIDRTAAAASPFCSSVCSDQITYRAHMDSVQTVRQRRHSGVFAHPWDPATLSAASAGTELVRPKSAPPVEVCWLAQPTDGYASDETQSESGPSDSSDESSPPSTRPSS